MNECLVVRRRHCCGTNPDKIVVKSSSFCGTGKSIHCHS